MNKTHNLLAILFFYITACQDSSHPGLVNECLDSDYPSNYQVEFDHKTEIEQPVAYDGQFPNYAYYYDSKNSTEYIAFCGNGQAIQIFDMTRGVLKSVIEPNQQTRILDDIGNFYFHNLDSIFLFNAIAPKTFLVDTKGKLQNSWDLSGAPIDWRNVTEYMLFASNPSLILDEKKFFISFNTSSYFKINDRINLKTQGIFDFEKSSWDTVYGKPADVYNTNDKIRFISALTVPSRVLSNDKIVISYPLSHEVQVYDKSGTLKVEACASSQYIEKLDDLTPSTARRDKQKEFMRFSATPSYLGIYYHSDLNIYTRLVRRKFDIELNGSLRSPCEIQYSLIILDSQFNKIDEISLDDHLYDWRFAIATKNGFWLMPICDQWPGEEVMNYTTHLKLKTLSLG